MLNKILEDTKLGRVADTLEGRIHMKCNKDESCTWYGTIACTRNWEMTL